MPARRLGFRQAALLGLLFCALFASSASAQVITAAIRGTVTSSDDGLPIVDAEVVLVHVPSGNEKSARTNESGGFAFTGLRIGGPYTVTVQSLGFAPFEQKEVFLTAGRTRDINVGLRLTEEVINITVTSTPRNASQKTVISGEDIGELPSIGRDPKDMVRLTPGAYTDNSNNKALSIDGSNSRYNSVTVDGTRQDDDFGLNASGYPTRRSPVALSAVEEVAVESSPFDVRYGKFLGGNVNIVTKTGTNDFHGQVIATYAGTAGGDFYGGNLLLGDRTRANKFKADFDEFRFGGTVGGPIVEDKVHFLASVEGLQSTTPVDAGPAGSDAANITSRVTLDQMNEAIRIARENYNFNAGEPAKSLDESDLKILGKVDWAINDQHRASVSYQRTAGNSISQGSTSNDATLSLSSNWYNAKDNLNTVALRLFSDWSDKLSSEVEVSGKLVSSRVPPTNGNDFAAVTIRTPANGSIVLGPDEFRHANELDNNLFHVRGQATYLQNSHLITAGVEFDKLYVDNLFVAGSRGVVEYASLAAFDARMPTSIRYKNAITQNPEDAAADWDSGIMAGYIQDQWEATPDLTLQGGVRYERYMASDNIVENSIFVGRYGFSNTSTIDGRDSILPRFGASYRAANRLNLRGGFGLYGGGTPNVWVSNAYTNDGVRVDTDTATGAADAAILAGFDGRNIPQALKDRLVAGDGNVDAIDPNFEIPTSWKFAAGLDYSFDIPGLGEQGEDVELKLNYTYTKVRYGIRWRDLRRNLDDVGDTNLPVATGPDGRAIYDTVGNTTTDRFNPNRGYDLLLDNTDEGFSHSATIGLEKRFPFGLTLIGNYAWVHSEEVSPGTSSTSISNYSLAAVGLDPNKPELATSNYEREHRITGIVQFSRAILKDLWPCCERPWKDMRTTFSMFYEGRSGQPFSYTFADNATGTNLSRIFGEEREFSRRNRMLFYVPKGDGSDVTLMGIDEAQFNQFLKDRGLDKYRGEITPRNAFRSSWLNRFDMRISQDLPAPVAGHRARFVLDVENLGNLLNNDWGRFTQVGFPYTTPVVDVAYDAANNKYVYSNLRVLKPQQVNVLQSVWRMSVGLLYDF